MREMWVSPTGAMLVLEHDGPHTFHRFDGVSTWTTGSLSFQAVALAGRAMTDLYAVGGNNVAHYNGSAWSLINANTTASLDDVTVGPTNVFAVALSGSTTVAVRYDGTTWSETPMPADTRGVIVLHYNGKKWAPVKMPASHYHSGIAARDDLVIVGAGSSTITTIVRDAAW